MSEQLYSVNASNFLLSSLLNNTNFLYNKSYPLEKDDFKPNLSQRIIYITICQLADRGCISIDPKEFVTYLEEGYEEQLNALKDDISDGDVVSYINTLKQLDNEKSYSYWYSEVRKRSLLREYRDEGFNIKDFWDEDKSEEKNIVKLNKYSILDIVKYYDKMQNATRQKYVVEENVRRIQAGVGFEDVKEMFKDTPYFGACMVSPFQTTLFRGWSKGQLLMNSAPSGQGKAQPVDTIIPTPNGKKRLGDIKVGDYVFDRYGKPTKVLGVYPQGIIDNYKITFKDGRSTYCNNEHLWNVIYHNSHKWVEKTVDTNFIIDYKNKKYTKPTISIPLCNQVEYDIKNFDIDPYVIGSFIGNGCCTLDELELSSQDIEQVNEVARLIGAEAVYRNDNHWGFKILNGKKEKRKNCCDMCNKFYHTKQFFEKYKDNLMCYSHEKSIPIEYKYCSVEQRYSLLQGLFDTDGHIEKRCGKNGYCYYDISYSTTSEKLKNDILEILYSLGHRASCYKTTRKNRDCRAVYVIHANVDNLYKPKFFRLSRKKDVAVESLKHIQYQRYDKLDIKSIEKMPNQCEMVCIYVDNEEHLYLTNDYIVTHNTVRAVGELCNVCATKIWDDEKQEYIENPNRQGAGLYINTEMDLELELTPCFIAYISNVSRSDIMDGKYKSKEEEARVDEAIKILKESDIFLVDDPNFTIRSIEDNIKFYKEQYNIQYMVFDYVQDNGCVSKEMHKTHDVIARDTIILNIASNLKVWARQYDIGIYTMTQLNGNEKNAEIIDEGCLAGGRSIKNKLDAGCISLYPSRKEFKFTEGLLMHWKSENRRGAFCDDDFKPNIVLHNYKVRFSKYGVGIKLYQYLDKSTGRCIDLYCTDLYDNPINIKKTMIKD